jgi:hypothetical protein
VGLSLGRSPLGVPFQRAPIWTQNQRAGVAPVVINQAAGMRWLRLTVAAGAGAATIQLPWQSNLITVPAGMTFAEEFTPDQAPIAPLSSGIGGAWQTILAGAVAAWSFLEGA